MGDAIIGERQEAEEAPCTVLDQMSFKVLDYVRTRLNDGRTLSADERFELGRKLDAVIMSLFSYEPEYERTPITEAIMHGKPVWPDHCQHLNDTKGRGEFIATICCADGRMGDVYYMPGRTFDDKYCIRYGERDDKYISPGAKEIGLGRSLYTFMIVNRASECERREKNDPLADELNKPGEWNW